MKRPEEIKKGIYHCSLVGRETCLDCPYDDGHIDCAKDKNLDALAYIKQLESSRWELFEDLSTAYYGKQMYGLNDDGTVYSRYSCDTMSFDQAVGEFRRLIADE